MNDSANTIHPTTEPPSSPTSPHAQNAAWRWIFSLLLIEPDATMRATLASGLRDVGYRVDAVSSLPEAEHCLHAHMYDAMVLEVDLDTPKAGLQWLQHLRDDGVILPAMLLSNRTMLHDRIAGLDAGADDYVIKPFEREEVYARLRSILRRSNPHLALNLERDGLRLDWASRTASLDGRPVNLSGLEFALLEVLVSRPGKPFSQRELRSQLSLELRSREVSQHVTSIRRKLGQRVIETVRGLGYRFPAGT